MSDTNKPVNLNMEKCKISSEVPTLLELPAEVLDRILDRLDLTSLKTFRLVCRTTNALIERPKYLQHYWMYIKSNNLHKILRSPTKYPNYVIQLNTVTNWSALMPFIRHTQAWLSNLKIHVSNIPPNEVVNILLNTGPQLQSFTTRAILQDGLPAAQELEELKILVEKSDHILQQNLIGLQEFNIANTLHEERQVTICLMEMFFKYCPGLVTLNVPVIRQKGNDEYVQLVQHHLQMQLVQPVAVEDETDEAKCLPLFHYLKKIHLKETQNLSKIDFWSHTLKYSQFMGISRYKPLFPMTVSTLTQVLKLCEPTKVKLYNVPISALPNQLLISLHFRELLNERVASILSVPGVPEFKNVPPGCPLNIVISAFNCNDENAKFEPNHHINIASITLIYEMMRNENMERIMSSILTVYRPTVSELAVYGQSAVKAVRTHGLSFFPNLKKLHLHGNPDRYADDLNRTRIPGSVITLPRLDSLDLEFIEVFFDEILGEEEIDRWLAKMRQLQHFRLNNCKLRSRSDPRAAGNHVEVDWN